MNKLRGRSGKTAVFRRTVAAALLAVFWLSFPAGQVLPADRPTDETFSIPSSADPSSEDKFFRWGGELKLIGSASWPGSGSLIQPEGDKTFFDGLGELRLKGEFFFTDWMNLEIHNLTGYTGGDTRNGVLNASLPVFLSQSDIPGAPPSDKRQLFDMSWTWDTEKEFTGYDRIDRAALTFKKDWALLSLGRQAITWGNGLIFNPLDLINPFGPTDVVREYKVGQDMAFAQLSAGRYGNLQLLYAPRRNPDTDTVEEQESAFATKLHFGAGKTGFDLIGAKNFGDKIAGAGGSGHLGDAILRTDVLYTWPDEDQGQNPYLSGVANLDYSWTWWGKNWYGFVEVFFNGVGKTNYASALAEPYIQKKLSEQILFTLGQWYADGNIRVELHPLFNVYLTVISNAVDPSWIVQPRICWDFAKSFRLTLWGNIAFGPKESEYGGFQVPGTDLDRKPPNGGFAWLSYYF